MKDLTHGSIASHILLAPPIVAGMVTIMICQLVDLYFVAGLGDAAIAGVAAAGNAGFLINALMQVLGVGTVALISHAVGRKDRADANLVLTVARPRVRWLHAAPIIWLSTRPGFRIEQVWYLSIATTTAAGRLELVAAAPRVQEAAGSARALISPGARRTEVIPELAAPEPAVAAAARGSA